MTIIVKFSFLLIFAVSIPAFVEGQTYFNGSFLMDFKTSMDTEKDFPMIWNIERELDGGRMVLEIQDEMQKMGVSKRVLFNPKDSTWTMMMQYNKVKQGTRIHAAKMFNDSIKPKSFEINNTKEKRIISGYA